MSAKIIRLREIDGIIFADSLDVAHDFAKRHDHVLRDVDEIRQNISPNLGRSWLRDDCYFDTYGRRQRRVLMTEEGWQFVVMNIQGMYDWKEAYILKFKEMREKLGAGARIEVLFDRTKRENVGAFPQQLIAQGELFEAPPEADLPIVDPARAEAELEAELQKYNLEFGYEKQLPKALVPTDEKQRHLILEGWRLRHHNLPPNQLQWKGYWNDTPQVCFGPGGMLVERWDFDDDDRL